MNVNVAAVKRLKELEEYLIPLSKEEFARLEENLIAEGCREPLAVWENNGKLIVVDGHNRFNICRKHGISFRVQKYSFSSLDEVKTWMINNQMGRRNLNPEQISFYRGLKYLSLKKSKGGYESVKSKGQSDLSTSTKVAKTFNVSESTVKRDAKFAEGIMIIGRSNNDLKNRILLGQSTAKKSDIQILAESKDKDTLTFKNDADLYNKAKRIRNELVKEVESGINRIEENRIRNAKEILDKAEPAFLNENDKLNRIKGQIISAINRAIKDKDRKSVRELKVLIDKLLQAITN